MADNTIDIRIDVEGNAKVQLDKLGDSVESFEKTTKKSFANAGRIFDNFVANVAADALSKGFELAGRAVTGFVGVLRSGVRAAQVQEDAVNQLNTALRSTGDFTEETSKSFQDFAASLQDVTTFGDEVLISQLALAKSFGATNDQAKDLVAAAADLAAGTGISLDSAVRNLAKTFSGLTGELGELVPGVRSLTKEQLQAGNAIQVVAKTFDGFARSQARTFSGAIAQAEGRLGDLLEKIGETITKNPVFIAAINQAAKIFKDLTRVISDNSEEIVDFINRVLIGAVKVFRTGFVPAVAAGAKVILELTKVVVTAKGGFAAFTEGLKQYAGSLRGGTVNTQKILDATKGASDQIRTLNKLIKEIDSDDGIFAVAIDKAFILERGLKRAKEEAKGLKDATDQTDTDDIDTPGVAFDLRALLDKEDEITATKLKKLDERIAAEAELADEGRSIELEKLFAQREAILSNLSEGGDERLKLRAAENAEAIKLAKEVDAEQKKIDDKAKARRKADNEARLAGAKQFFGGLATLQQSGNKELFEIGKAAALAGAIVDGAAAFVKTLKEGPPFPFNIAAAAGIAAQTAVQVATIASTQFKAQRGLTEVPPGFPNDTFSAALTSGERVVSAEQNRDLKEFLESNQGLSSRIDALIESQSTDRPIVIQVDGATILDVVQEQVDSGRTLNL